MKNLEDFLDAGERKKNHCFSVTVHPHWYMLYRYITISQKSQASI